MLKRVLTIGFLFVIAVVLMAADPGQFGDEDTTVINSLSHSVDGVSYVVWWWEVDGTGGTPAESISDDFEDITLPKALLSMLPAEVQAMFEDDYAAQTTEINGCVLAANAPYKSGTKVKTRSDISCIAVNVTHTRLEIDLERNTGGGYYVIADYDSEWQTWTSHGRTVTGSCWLDPYSYRNYTTGSIRLDDGTEDSQSADESATIGCS